MEGLCVRGLTRGERRPTRFLNSLPSPTAGPQQGRLMPRPSSNRFTGASAPARRGASLSCGGSRRPLQRSSKNGSTKPLRRDSRIASPCWVREGSAYHGVVGRRRFSLRPFSFSPSSCGGGLGFSKGGSSPPPPTPAVRRPAAAAAAALLRPLRFPPRFLLFAPALRYVPDLGD